MYNIKICSKFNSIEYSSEKLPTSAELQAVYDRLAGVAVKDEDMPQRAAAKKPTNDKPASESQLKAMGWMGIKIPKDCTMAQARALMMKWNKEHNTDPV